MQLDWNRIVCNAITVLVASVFVGAAAHLWAGVQSIDSRIDSNLEDIKATQAILSPKVDVIENRLAEILVIIEPGDGKPNLPKKRTKDLIDERRMQQQVQRGH